ncbi:MAG: hypothetical protein Q8K55_12840 [Gemmatimonadaceae bacterium]|nr:hypothetical protein [Gemmatimonadaceae bacterium]
MRLPVVLRPAALVLGATLLAATLPAQEPGALRDVGAGRYEVVLQGRVPATLHRDHRHASS